MKEMFIENDQTICKQKDSTYTPSQCTRKHHLFLNGLGNTGQNTHKSVRQDQSP